MDLAVEVTKLLREGGPWAMSALAISAWVWERKENKALQRAILELATAQTEAVLRHEASVATIKDLLAAFIGRRRG